MSDKIVSLNRIRKKRERAAKKKEADENAVRLGRTKAARVLDAARTAQARKRLEDKRLARETGEPQPTARVTPLQGERPDAPTPDYGYREP